MAFIRPPFFQPSSAPAASRGLANSGIVFGMFATFRQDLGAGAMWMELTLPDDYVTGDGFTVEVDSRFNSKDAAIHGKLVGFGNTLNGGSFLNVGPGLYLAPGDETVGYADPAADQDITPVTLTTSVFNVPGSNHGFPAGPNGGGTALPILIYDNGHNPIPTGGIPNFMDNSSDPPIDNYQLFAADIGLGLIAPSTVLIGTFGSPVQNAGGIANNTRQYSAGDTINVYIGYMFGPGVTSFAPGLIYGVRTKINSVYRNVLFDAFYTGYGSGNPGQYSPAHLLDFVYPPYQDMYLSGQVIPSAIAAPKILRAPQIMGTPEVGETLTLAEHGYWGRWPRQFENRWTADNVPIPGETGPTYTILVADEGKIIRCEQRANGPTGYYDGKWSPWAKSNALGPVTNPAPPAYVTGAVDFDGATELINSMLSTPDSPYVAFSQWATISQVMALTDYWTHWISDPENQYNNFFGAYGDKTDSSYPAVVAENIETNVAVTANFWPGDEPHEWYHLLGCFDLASVPPRMALLVNGTNGLLYGGPSVPFTDGPGTMTLDNLPFHIGNDGYGYFWKGCFADFWWTSGPEANWLDGGGEIPLEIVTKFIAGGKPVDLGPDGSLPTGVAPSIFLRAVPGDEVATFSTNLGTGGPFAVSGALTACATSPTDPGTYDDGSAGAPLNAPRWPTLLNTDAGTNLNGVAMPFPPPFGVPDVNYGTGCDPGTVFLDITDAGDRAAFLPPTVAYIPWDGVSGGYLRVDDPTPVVIEGWDLSGYGLYNPGGTQITFRNCKFTIGPQLFGFYQMDPSTDTAPVTIQKCEIYGEWASGGNTGNMIGIPNQGALIEYTYFEHLPSDAINAYSKLGITGPCIVRYNSSDGAGSSWLDHADFFQIFDNGVLQTGNFDFIEVYGNLFYASNANASHQGATQNSIGRLGDLANSTSNNPKFHHNVQVSIGINHTGNDSGVQTNAYPGFINVWQFGDNVINLELHDNYFFGTSSVGYDPTDRCVFGYYYQGTTTATYTIANNIKIWDGTAFPNTLP